MLARRLGWGGEGGGRGCRRGQYKKLSIVCAWAIIIYIRRFIFFSCCCCCCCSPRYFCSRFFCELCVWPRVCVCVWVRARVWFEAPVVRLSTQPLRETIDFMHNSWMAACFAWFIHTRLLVCTQGASVPIRRHTHTQHTPKYNMVLSTGDGIRLNAVRARGLIWEAKGI